MIFSYYFLEYYVSLFSSVGLSLSLFPSLPLSSFKLDGIFCSKHRGPYKLFCHRRCQCHCCHCCTLCFNWIQFLLRLFNFFLSQSKTVMIIEPPYSSQKYFNIVTDTNCQNKKKIDSIKLSKFLKSHI